MSAVTSLFGTSLSRHRVKARLALVITAATLVLAGCSNTLPGTAASVGGNRITVDSLQSQVDAVLAYRDGQQGSTVRTQLPTITQQVLSGDVLHELVGMAVARTHLAVNPSLPGSGSVHRVSVGTKPGG